MKAKSGKAGSAANPKSPEEAKEAATEKPAETQQAQATQSQPPAASLDSKQLGNAGSAAKQQQDEPAETHWIGIELKDEEGNPVADESFRVKLADGSIRTGRLDEEGKARLEDVPAGKHEINFPRIHGDEWKAGG